MLVRLGSVETAAPPAGAAVGVSRRGISKDDVALFERDNASARAVGWLGAIVWYLLDAHMLQGAPRADGKPHPRPWISVWDVSSGLGIDSQHAYRLLAQLEAAGVLQRSNEPGRFVLPEV